MEATNILDSIRSAGFTISLLPGDILKVAPADQITSEMRETIRKNKELIVRHILTELSAPDEVPSQYSKSPQNDTTPLYFEDIEDRFLPSQDDFMDELPQRATKKIKPSSIALKWLLDHRQALDKAGWTRAELYRRNKYKRGIAWLDLWDKPFLLAYLHDNGVIEFECSINGRDYIQTARPFLMSTIPIADKRETIFQERKQRNKT